MRSLLRFFKSLKFTIVIILCLSVIFLIGLVVPQKSLLGTDLYLQWKANRPELVSFLEAANLTDIYVSPVTVLLLALFFLHLIVVMSGRIPAVWKRCVRADMPGTIDSIKGGSSHETLVPLSTTSPREVLQKRGYSFRESDELFHAVKNRFSPLATVVFHLSFLLLLVGGLLTFYTKFRGEVDVGVGETFNGVYQWKKLPKIGEAPDIAFSVASVRPRYHQKAITVDLAVDIITKNGMQTIGINKPYREGPLSLVIKYIDVAPLFVLYDKKGREVESGYPKLKTLRGGEDSFRMLGYEFNTVFHADLAGSDPPPSRKAGNMPQISKEFIPDGRKRTLEIVDPAFSISVYKKGVLLEEEIVRLGDAIEFNGHKMVFQDLTYWVDFYVGKEYGLGAVYTAFVLMTIALIVRFVFFRREIGGFYTDGVLHLSGRAEYFPALFEDEFQGIVADMRGRSSGSEHERAEQTN